MKMQGSINEKDMQLIKAGASMAATNQESFKEAFDRLVALGTETEEIQFAAGVGKAVREKPAEKMKKYAEQLFAVDQLATAEAKGCPAEKMKGSTDYRLMMLIAVGSAVAANCEPCLNQSVLELNDAGVHEDDIHLAAEIGFQVKKFKLADILEVAAVLTGIDEERSVACQV